MNKKTLVLGASANPTRYSYLAVKKLKAYKHPVVALGRKEADIDGTAILTGQPPLDQIDTVTLYLNPANQVSYYNYILSLKPKRIIFNPGTENDELAQMAAKQGIEPVEACTLVLLSTGQY
ncbi:MAG: CoA-binding protein [Ferruginibacter sp.]